MRARYAFVLALVAACTEQKPPAPSPDLAQAVVAPPPEPATPPRPPIPPPPPPSLPKPPAGFVAVQVSGQLTLPVNEKGDPHVFVTDGECWKSGTKAFLDKPVPGAFTLETAVPKGTTLYVCAALIEGPKAKPTVYGAATNGALKPEGEGPGIFTALDVPLKKGPPVPKPALRK